jgi:murein DD-endopeptidase MepM/ murein hydrolase activator NlpD
LLNIIDELIMKRLLLSIIVCVPLYYLKAQSKYLKFNTEKQGSYQELYVTNSGNGNITLAVEFDQLDNCNSNPYSPEVTVHPGEYTKIATISRSASNEAWKYHYKFWSVWGSTNAMHDGTTYQLPYYSGKSFKVIQGFNGTLTHFGDQAYAIDWNMPENTPVLAARGGIVVDTEESFSEGGASDYYKDEVNFVKILHSDGTIGRYFHFGYGKVNVSAGQKVKAGELIGYSGNTGFSTCPHLHFDVSKPINGKQMESVPFAFSTSNSDSDELIQGQVYIAP